MEYLWIAILVVAIFIAFVIFKSRGTAKSERNSLSSNETVLPVKFEPNGISIPIERLPPAIEINDNNLFEITDSTVISRISQTFPAVAQTAANTVAKKIANETLNNPQMFLVKIPSGTSLVNPTKKGVQYATYKGAKKGLAEVVKPDLTKITRATAVANGVANVMNVGSLVVGQYYMTEVNSKLEEMSKSIDKISDFQDREFKSRILALIVRLGEISHFSSEIMESDSLRNRKLQTLDDLMGECTQLLQQVNLTVDDEIKKNPQTDYKEYQAKVDDFNILYEYQKMLLSILEEISKLTYLLGKGENTNEMCYSIFNTYLKQSEQIRANLETWHDNQTGLLRIDVDMNRKSRTGIEGFFAAIPGFVDDKWKYKELRNGLGQKITAQKANRQLMISKHEEIYENDVQIIIKDGRYYYVKGECCEHN